MISQGTSSFKLLKRLHPDIWPCLAIVVVGLLALWPYLFEAKALYWGDIELYFAPMQQFLNANLSHGSIPLWNPNILCGQPFVGNPQTWVLYPSTILASSMSPWTFLTVSATAHLIVGGIFFYLLARDNQRSRVASVLAAVTFMLGGFFASKVQFPNMAQAIAYVPIILLLAGKLAVRPNLRQAVLLGFFFGLQLLAAHAQVSVMTLYLAAVYSIYRAWPQLRNQGHHWRAVVGWAIAAGLFAACLDAGQLLPLLDLWRHSDRQTLTLGVANRFILQPNQVTNFFWANRYGSPFTGNFHHRGNYWEAACYLGITPCLLLLYTTVLSVKHKASSSLFWILILILSVWLAIGRTGGLYNIAFYLAPAVKAFHDPARMLMGAAVAGPMLAAIGLDYLLQSITNKKLCTVLGCAVIVATAIDLGVFVRHIYPLMPVRQIEAAARDNAADSAALARAGHRVMFAPGERSTWQFFIDYSNFQIQDPIYFPELLATHTPNTGMITGLADAGGYEPEPVQGAVKRYADAYKHHQLGDDSGLNDLNVDSVITFERNAQPSGSSFFNSHTCRVWSNIQTTKATGAKLQSGGANVAVTDINPDLIGIAVPPGVSGRIMVSTTDFPGWHAHAGRQELAINRRSDGLMSIAPPSRAVPETVTLKYEPAAWRVGLYLTLSALAFALGFGVYTVLSFVRPVR